jgi:hypothetical protein
VDTFATETEANFDMTPEEIKAAVQAKTAATKELSLSSLKCFPFFMPRLSNLKEGMTGLVDFIWIGHHGVLLPVDGCFLAQYGRLLNNFGMFVLHNFFIFAVLLFAQMEPFVNSIFSRYHLNLQSLN